MTDPHTPDPRPAAIRALATRLAAVAAAVFACALLLLALGVSPLAAARTVAAGSFGSAGKLGYVTMAWVPLCLCAAGLLVTFAAGLWNIGIEGQVVVGAICTTGALRALGSELPPAAALALGLAAGFAGGALWAGLAAALRLWGGVHEIFAGLGLNFIAGSLTVYLVFGPWKRPGIASSSGTDPFGPALWLPTFAGWKVSPVEVGLALAALALVAFLLRGTHFGLRLKALGRNPRAARVLGVATGAHLGAAFALCGALAGLTGGLLVVGVSARHNLFPLISSGYGFLAILVVLLAGQRALWCLPVSLFFAAITMGSLQLPLQLQLDASLGGVLQGVLVLAVLVGRGLEARRPQAGGPADG